MHARVTRLEASPERLDEMTRQFEERTVPVLEGLAGYKGYVLLGDRGSGAAMAVTYWESEEALRGSDDAVTAERERAAETAGAAAGPHGRALRGGLRFVGRAATGRLRREPCHTTAA